MRVKLGDYIQEYSERNRLQEDIPVYSVTNTHGFCTDYFGKEVASKDKSTYKIVPYGCFAYNPSRINVGSVDWQHVAERVIVSPLYVVFSVSEQILPQYLYYYLKSDISLTFIKAVATGSVRDNLKFSALSEFPFELRPISDQKLIVDRLDKIGDIISMRQQELAALDDLIKARFVEMFGENTPNTITLKDCCLDVRGGGTPSMKHPEYYGGNVPFIKSGDVRGDIVMSGALWLTDKALAETTAKYIPSGAVLVVNRSAALLKEFRAAIAGQPVVINQDIKAFVPKSEFTSQYLLWAIKIQTQYLLTKVTTVLTSHIDLKDLLDLRIAPASIERQDSFSSFVAQIDKSKYDIDTSAYLCAQFSQSYRQERMI